MDEERTVFERLLDTINTGRGVTLSFADVHLLLEFLGDEVAQAQDDYESWRERFREYDDLKRGEREVEPVESAG